MQRQQEGTSTTNSPLPVPQPVESPSAGLRVPLAPGRRPSSSRSPGPATQPGGYAPVTPGSRASGPMYVIQSTTRPRTTSRDRAGSTITKIAIACLQFTPDKRYALPAPSVGPRRRSATSTAFHLSLFENLATRNLHLPSRSRSPSPLPPPGPSPHPPGFPRPSWFQRRLPARSRPPPVRQPKMSGDGRRRKQRITERFYGELMTKSAS